MESTKHVLKRWGFDGEWPYKPDQRKEGLMLAISLGLGALFNEVAEAEEAWMKMHHPKLDGKRPLDLILGGSTKNMERVKSVVDDECSVR